jgi:hypothetical protein
LQLDSTNWSGDGDFTLLLIEALKGIEDIEFLRIEDAPAGRNEPSYAFISNEVFVGFRTKTLQVSVRRLLVFSGTRQVAVKAMTFAGLERALTAMEGIGEPDYSDEGMIQYLRAHRIVAPYQTRGFKIVEMVRIYEVGAEPRRQPP